MHRALKQPPTQQAKNLQPPTPNAPTEITPVQVWSRLSATEQQRLRRTLVGVCRTLADLPAGVAALREVRDDES